MVTNLRDLGGIVAADGHRIRRGCLVRSANLNGAAPEDLDGVTEIIDLRTGLEAEKMPDAVLPGIRRHHIPIFSEAAAGITREGSLNEVPDMAGLYRAMLTEEEYRMQLRNILGLIFAHDYTDGAILWHCTAGKDRCGIVTALVLLALGVDRGTVMEDYLKSNEDCAAEAEQIYRMLIGKGTAAPAADAVREVFLAKTEFLRAALDAYDEKPLEFPDAGAFRRSVLI